MVAVSLQSNVCLEPKKAKLESDFFPGIHKWFLYIALLKRCWKPGDDERAVLQDRHDARTTNEDDTNSPQPGDLDYPEEEWTDEETILARLHMDGDSDDEW